MCSMPELELAGSVHRQHEVPNLLQVLLVLPLDLSCLQQMLTSSGLQVVEGMPQGMHLPDPQGLMDKKHFQSGG